MSYQFRHILEFKKKEQFKVFAWLQKWWEALGTFPGHSHMLNLTAVETDSENEEPQEQKDNTENERKQKQQSIGKSNILLENNLFGTLLLQNYYCVNNN